MSPSPQIQDRATGPETLLIPARPPIVPTAKQTPIEGHSACGICGISTSGERVFRHRAGLYLDATWRLCDDCQPLYDQCSRGGDARCLTSVLASAYLGITTPSAWPWAPDLAASRTDLFPHEDGPGYSARWLHVKPVEDALADFEHWKATAYGVPPNPPYRACGACGLRRAPVGAWAQKALRIGRQRFPLCDLCQDDAHLDRGYGITGPNDQLCAAALGLSSVRRFFAKDNGFQHWAEVPGAAPSDSRWAYLDPDTRAQLLAAAASKTDPSEVQRFIHATQGARS